MFKRFLMLSACAFVVAGCGISAEEFASQVASNEQRIKADTAYEREVTGLCTNLSDQRKQEEPRCVALEKVALDKVFGKLDSSRLK
jgi:hypothetical protein